jgi:hypothetical protein
VNAAQLLARHGEQAERVARAQVVLARERDLLEVVECLELRQVPAARDAPQARDDLL